MCCFICFFMSYKLGKQQESLPLCVSFSLSFIYLGYRWPLSLDRKRWVKCFKEYLRNRVYGGALFKKLDRIWLRTKIGFPQILKNKEKDFVTVFLA